MSLETCVLKLATWHCANAVDFSNALHALGLKSDEEAEEFNKKHVMRLADMYAMFFCDSKSVQPICMYELGKQLTYNDCVYDNAYKFLYTLIGVEEEYSCKDDVLRGSKEQRYEDFAKKIIFRINSLSHKS